MLVTKVIHDLNLSFALKFLGSLQYFLVFEAHRSCHGITLTQSKYTWDLIVKVGLGEFKPCPTPLAFASKLASADGQPFDDATLYRSTVSALQYLTLSRPDLAFAMNKLSQFLSAPSQVHCQSVKRVLRFVRDTLSYGLSCTAAPKLELEGFADADWASSLDDYKSTRGYCLYLGGNLIS
ncbi:hypothetical protein ACOSQ3_032520 [Xanthoceras sorbifolium]